MKRYFLLFFVLCFASTVVRAESELLIKRPQYQQSNSIVKIDGESFYVHSVGKGETLYSLAKLYGVTVEDINKNNAKVVERGLQMGDSIKIPVVSQGTNKKMSEKRKKKLFDTHTVAKGETAYSISRNYQISVATLMEDNPTLDLLHMQIGQQLLIRKKEQGVSSEEQIASEIDSYTDRVNSVMDSCVYHFVEKGETVYGITHKYGITEDVFRSANDLSQGLKAGAIVKVPLEVKRVVVEEKEDDKTEDTTESTHKDRENVSVAPAFESGSINIAMLLPLKVNGKVNENYLDFYEGFLLALDEVKASGESVKLNLYNTSSRDKSGLGTILSDQAFAKSDLIVGPVYEEQIEAVLDFAHNRKIPVVSPLSVINDTRSSLLYQLAPSNINKFDKLKPVFEGDKNIVYFTVASADKELDGTIVSMLSGKVYKNANEKSNFSTLIDRKRENVFVVLSESEAEVDKILSSIGSALSAITTRGGSVGEVKVVGSPKWNRFGNIDRDKFFKLGVTYISNYHAKRDEKLVREFDSKYISAYKMFPSLYSYRGYDAGKIFCAGLKSVGGLERYVTGDIHTPLQTTYRFIQADKGGIYENREWLLVRYNSDYTITVE